MRSVLAALSQGFAINDGGLCLSRISKSRFMPCIVVCFIVEVDQVYLFGHLKCCLHSYAIHLSSIKRRVESQI